MVDGANRWQRFRNVTLPQLRPTILLVITLGLIGTWQVFDQIYVMTQGGPAKTTLTPAYLSYTAAFNQNSGARARRSRSCCSCSSSCSPALQRFVLRDQDVAKRAQGRARRSGAPRRRGRRHDADRTVGSTVARMPGHRGATAIARHRAPAVPKGRRRRLVVDRSGP